MKLKQLTLPVVLLLSLLLTVTGCSVVTGAAPGNTTLAAGHGVFRSDTYHLAAPLPDGWAAADGPFFIPLHLDGWVAFNSWGEAGFFAGPQVEGTSQTFGPGPVMAQLPSGGGYIAIVETTMPPAPGNEPPEYTTRDLSGLYTPHDWRMDPEASFINFYKWGRNLTLVIACKPDATDETEAQLNDFLAGFRFDAIPEGDPLWMGLQARQLLPADVGPQFFSAKAGSTGDAGAARTTEITAYGDGLLFHFTYISSSGSRWWEITVTPFGDARLKDEGSGQIPRLGSPP